MQDPELVLRKAFQKGINTGNPHLMLAVASLKPEYLSLCDFKQPISTIDTEFAQELAKYTANFNPDRIVINDDLLPDSRMDVCDEDYTEWIDDLSWTKIPISANTSSNSTSSSSSSSSSSNLQPPTTRQASRPPPPPNTRTPDPKPIPAPIAKALVPEPEASQPKNPFVSAGSLIGRTAAKKPQPSKEPSKVATPDPSIPPDLQHLEPHLIERIVAEIIDNSDPVSFSDIAGLEFAKRNVTELVCWPMSRPDLFTGLRTLPKGLLLFGPPGTGKTLIGKAIACQSGSTFFNISASSLTSKWVGEGEKMVRVLFSVARHRQPSVIFIDEVDSLLSQRSSDENEASRKIKTEFLVQLDGAGTRSSDFVLVIGATNRPGELDEAARRRFVKRLYIPLPERKGRADLLTRLLSSNSHSLNEEQIIDVVTHSEGFSGADMKELCTEAAMGPLRDLSASDGIESMKVCNLPPISYRHFQDALRVMRPSVSQDDLKGYLDWNKSFGTFPRQTEDL